MTRRVVLGVAAALLVGAIASPGASAATLPATCSNFGTTLSGAGTGDTIVLTGLCTDGQATFTLPATANLTIQGAASGTNGFDGTGVSTPALNGAPPGTTPNGLTLRNLTFENYPSTAAVKVDTQNVGNPYSILGDTFSNNTNSAGDGGGLSLAVHLIGACTLSTPLITVSGSTFTGNSAGGSGGGPVGASGGGGGGAFLDQECQSGPSSMSVVNNTFTGNTVTAPMGADRQGGGLYVAVGHAVVSKSISLTQTGNLISGNSITGTGGTYFGGGEFTFGADLTSAGDRLINNSLPGSTTSGKISQGGGLATRSGGSCSSPAGDTSRATNLVVAGNTIGAPSGTGTGGEGAGIYVGCVIGAGGYDLTLVNSTVSGNQASGTGASAGAEGEATDLLHLQNTILTGNQGGADLEGFGASPGANVTAGNSDVCAIGGASPFAGAGNICAAPALVAPGPGTADVHETAASPTIDAGSNAFIGATPTDAFGSPRIVPGKFCNAAIVDIGAAEFPAAPPCNSFTIGKVKGKTLFVDVASAGKVDVTQAGAGGSAAVAAAKKLLKLSTGSGGPGTVAVPLKLTKKAKKKLSQKGKLKLRVAVKFTPTGGTPNSKSAALKITQRKKKS